MTEPGYMLAVQGAKAKFNEIAQANPQVQVEWAKESGYAMQVLKKNTALAKCPIDTIKDAIVNVAAIGLSLNPAEKLAYLVPRDGGACLDISYQGLTKLATDAGIVEWAKAVLVRDGDEFEWIDFETRPKHKDTDPFNTKRDVVGGFVIAKLKTSDNQVMCEKMSRDELDDVKAVSKAKNGPWKTWPEEMMKKTLIKRASKSWPKSDGSSRFDNAVHMINQHDGLAETDITETTVQLISDNQLETIKEKLLVLKMRPIKICAAFEIDDLGDMPADRYDECIERLKQAEASKRVEEETEIAVNLGVENLKNAIDDDIIEGVLEEEIPAIAIEHGLQDDDLNEIHDALCQLWGLGDYSEGEPDPEMETILESHWKMPVKMLAKIAGITPPETTDEDN